jgi:hypothetical protein
VRLVDDEQRVVLPARRGELGQRGGVPEHGVDGLDHHHGAGLPAPGQRRAHRRDVVVAHGGHGRAGEPGAVDERGVDVGVGDQQRAGIAQGRQQAGVGGVAAGEDQRGLPAGELAQLALEPPVHGGGADDQAGRAGPGAEAVQGLPGGREHAGVPGEPQVVVGGEVERALGRRAVLADHVPGPPDAGPVGEPRPERGHRTAPAATARGAAPGQVS